MLPCRESSKKAHLGCHIDGIKWLACSWITCDGKGMHVNLWTFNFLCFSITESWKNHPLFMCYKHQCTLGYSAPLWVSWRSSWPSYSSVFMSFGACTKLLLVWIRRSSASATIPLYMAFRYCSAGAAGHEPSENENCLISRAASL